MPRGPLTQAEYEAVYAKVPRLTVEIVLASAEGVLLRKRDAEPCKGLWHLPGGTVRYGEFLTDAVRRVALQELHLEVVPKNVIGYIEYPSHLNLGIDWPVGIAFRTEMTAAAAVSFRPRTDEVGWFRQLPAEMHDEQREFLRLQGLAA